MSYRYEYTYINIYIHTHTQHIYIYICTWSYILSYIFIYSGERIMHINEYKESRGHRYIAKKKSHVSIRWTSITYWPCLLYTCLARVTFQPISMHILVLERTCRYATCLYPSAFFSRSFCFFFFYNATHIDKVLTNEGGRVNLLFLYDT